MSARDELMRRLEETPSIRPAEEETARLLDEVRGFVRRYVAINDSQATSIALWVLHTHAFEAAETTPYLSITSAEKMSGKTLLLEVLELLVARPWLTQRATPAALARKIDDQAPTLLLDESDATFKGGKEYSEALRGILNAGYRSSGRATVCVGQGANLSYRDFSTFCPKAMAGIGRLPDTVESRSIHVRLKRRGPGETVQRFRPRKVRDNSRRLQQEAESWGGQHAATLREAEPELPEALSDRSQDVWEPLLAIADLAGGHWPERARTAAADLSGQHEAEDDSVGVRLLGDIAAIRAERGEDEDKITAGDLLEALLELDESPWREWFGKPLSRRGLARLLHPFGIQARTVRIGDGTAKGFKWEQFEDAFSRYLPRGTSQRHNPHSNAENGDPPSVTSGSMLRTEIGLNLAPQAECDVVTDSGQGEYATEPLEPCEGGLAERLAEPTEVNSNGHRGLTPEDIASLERERIERKWGDV